MTTVLMRSKFFGRTPLSSAGYKTMQQTAECSTMSMLFGGFV